MRNHSGALACLPLLYGVTREVVQFFRDWYFHIGFEQVFAYAQTWDDAHDVAGVTWFVAPQCYSLGTPAYKGKLWYVRTPPG